MKLEIIKDISLKETLIKIYTAYIDTKTQRVIDLIEQDDCYIQGIKNEKSYFVKSEEIIRFYTAQKRVYFVTADATYRVKQRIYQLEEQLPSHFVKISQGELINLTFIQKLDLSIKGTIRVRFKNGSDSFVSRRTVKTFKERLGL